MNISIVVAAKNASATIRDSLKAWQDQLQQGDEILIVNASFDSTAQIVRSEYPEAKLLNLPKGTLIPELWSTGILESSRDLVAITIANCVPEASWIEKARTFLNSDYSAVGGAIANHHDASLVDTAVYLCRYWRYMPPFAAAETADLPGDNCIYRRSDLMKYQTLFHAGFWEPEINNRMKQEGLRMMLTPDLMVSHKKSSGFFAFIQNRLQHGFHFGGERSAKLNIVQRIAYLLASPMIPFLLLSRIWNAVKKNSANKRALFFSFPILIFFLAAWAAGEAFGYLAGPLQHENRN